jgi:hypothetical protein
MDQDEEDFRLRKYERDREHEIALNNAVAAYEQAMLRLLLVLNGGAATAFLALFGAIWKENTQLNLSLIRYAVLSWLVGLMVTVIATVLAYSGQVDFTRSYLNRRRAEERRRLVEGYEQIMGKDSKPDCCLDFEATKLRNSAGGKMKSARLVGLLALVLFVVGAWFAFKALDPLAVS